MASKSKFISDGLWVAGGQLFAALGMLVGVRLQTEFIPPEVYGEVVLFTGLSTLVLTIICVPYWRGAMIFFGEAASYGLQERLFGFVRNTVAKYLGITIILVLAIGGVYTAVTGGSHWAIIAISTLLVIDAARSVEMAFLNVSRQQRRYAVWSILEAWSRPICAVMAVQFLEAKVEVVLAGYVVASTATFSIFRKWALAPSLQYSDIELDRIKDLNQRLAKYSLPLMPQGLVGWLSALSDRYMLAAIVGLHEAGIYSAIYGLISRPFLMAQSVSELTIQPMYFHAVATRESQAETVIFKRWILVNAAIGIAVLTLCIGASDIIAMYLLGPAYSSSAHLIPYLAVGHLFLIVGYGLNGYLYAHQYTRQIFFFDCLAAALSLGIGPFAMYSFGVVGAAITCAVTYMIRMIAVAIFVYRKRGASQYPELEGGLL